MLIKNFLKNDPTYSPNFTDVWTYAEWTATQSVNSRGINKQDSGIDLVAKLANEDSYCAIQCKFYDENHKIQKSDLDTFFTASGKKEFSRRLVVETKRYQSACEGLPKGDRARLVKIQIHGISKIVAGGCVRVCK